MPSWAAKRNMKRSFGPSGFARPGTYRYATSGSSHSPFGDQDLSGTSTTTYDAASGSRQRNVSQGKGGSQEIVVAINRGGAYLAHLKLDSQGFKEEFAPAKPLLYFPAGASAGRTWSWSVRSTDGKYTLHASAELGPRGTVRVGAKTVHSRVVTSVLHITGNGIDMTVHQRDEVSEALGLVLREHAETEGTAYGAKFRSDVTRTLRSTDPS